MRYCTKCVILDTRPGCVLDFCDFLGYTETEFWHVVDRFYNREIFYKMSMESGS